MFENQKFLTRGVENEIPSWLINLMWHMVLTMEVTDYGQAVGTILAEPVAFRLIHVFNWVFCTAVCTNSRFAHCLFLHFVW